MTSVYGKEPLHWDLLDENDKKEYKTLQRDLSSTTCRNIRNQRLDQFKDMLELIKIYINRFDENDWKRSLVCGICWLNEGIAINTMQFSGLLGKCKSSINGSLQMLGYKPFPCSSSQNKELLDKIPYLKQNPAEIKQWTLRKKYTMKNEPSFTKTTQKSRIYMQENENIDTFNDQFPEIFDEWINDYENNSNNSIFNSFTFF